MTDHIPEKMAPTGETGKRYTQEEIAQLYRTVAQKKAQGKKVLVVDDSTFMRTWLSSLLDSNGYLLVPDEPMDGYDAIEAACNHQPHLIIMNINMPNLDGLSAAAEILGMFPEICIIFCSSENRAQEVERSIAVGGSDFVVIPCPAEVLLASVQKLY